MLRHVVERRLNVDAATCLACLLDAERFLGVSRYTYAIKRLNSDYEVVFRWVKLGITRYYRVRFRVFRGRDWVAYESVEGSDYEFSLAFTLKEEGGGLLLRAEARMKAGLMANLLGRRDFAGFVEELVDKGLAALLKKLAASRGRAPKSARSGAGGDCRTCLFYGGLTGFCYLHGVKVSNPSEPPCGGSDYIAARRG